MGRQQKQKGNRVERKIVGMLAERSVEAKRTWGSSGASMGLDDEVDIALVPVAVLKQNPSFNIVSDFCIGADGDVDTVSMSASGEYFVAGSNDDVDVCCVVVLY